MKKILILLMLLLFGVLFSACDSSESESGYKIFYINKSETQLCSEEYQPRARTTETLIDEFIVKLNTQPEDEDAKVPGLDTTYIQNYMLSTEGNIILNFDSEYLSLPVIKETLCRAAIVKTLCQIRGVNGVVFTVEGRSLADSNGNVYGYMSEETFVDNTSGETTYKQTINVSLYFADNTGKNLLKVPINMSFDGTISMEQLIVQQVIRGPESVKGVDKRLQATVSDKTSINQITVRESICYIDLSKDFLTVVPGVTKLCTLYSIVNSLVELADINKVQFTIDGEMVSFFGDSSIMFDVPLERNLEIIKE